MAICRIDTSACKGCGLCVNACPKGILALDDHNLNAKGYPPARLTQAELCIGCAVCATMCPDCAITVER
ncbi:MAG: 4Fe-4S binding protein [Clostridia bacterium]|nr:4Fe-4S binding protein [Clostridia bacterium]